MMKKVWDHDHVPPPEILCHLECLRHNLEILWPKIDRFSIDSFSAAANRGGGGGEVRVGQSVAFLTAAAVTPNELMNAIADATRMQPTAALMIQAN